MSFKSVFQDVRGSVDYVHMEVGIAGFERKGQGLREQFQGNLKQKTCDDLAKYVKRDERLPQVLLSQSCTPELNINFQVLYNLQKSGAKTFLLTNSGWEYTNQVLCKEGET